MFTNKDSNYKNVVDLLKMYKNELLTGDSDAENVAASDLAKINQRLDAALGRYDDDQTEEDEYDDNDDENSFRVQKKSSSDQEDSTGI